MWINEISQHSFIVFRDIPLLFFCSRSYGIFCCRRNCQVSSKYGHETTRARQAHFIKWCLAKHIVDPAGPEPGWQLVLAIYVKYVMKGVNYLNKESVRSATCKGYALDAAKLFTLRGFPSPVNFSDDSNWSRILVHNLEVELVFLIREISLAMKLSVVLIHLELTPRIASINR